MSKYFAPCLMCYSSLLYPTCFNTSLSPYSLLLLLRFKKKITVCCSSFHLYVESRRCYKSRTSFLSKDIRADRLLTFRSLSPKLPDTTRIPLTSSISKVQSPVLMRVAKFLAVPPSASKLPQTVIPRTWKGKYIFMY